MIIDSDMATRLGFGYLAGRRDLAGGGATSTRESLELNRRAARQRQALARYGAWGDDASGVGGSTAVVVPVPGFQMSATPKGFLIAVGFSVAVSLTVTAILRWWERR